jgi:PhnB protein
MTTNTDGTSTTQVQNYLFFGGRCDEALAFYKSALGAQVDMLMRFSESPSPMPPGMLEPGFEKKVMHSAFRVGATTILASDGCGTGSTFSGFSLALQVPTEADADCAFNALADGGNVTMPLGKTFWSPRYGMLTDRFGISWMVMVPQPMPAK